MDTSPPVRREALDERGFTLIELIVVVLILGILVAIALPTFLGARARAQDSAAMSSVRTALTAGRIIFSTEETYAAADLPTLRATETSIDWGDENDTSNRPTTVSRSIAGDVLTLAAFSHSGNCYFLLDDPPNDIRFGILFDVDPSQCYAANAGAVVFGPSW